MSDYCEVCGGVIADPHEHKPDLSGLDDGPYLPGSAPRRKPPPKTPDEMRAIRAKAWATRRLGAVGSPAGDRVATPDDAAQGGLL